MRRSSAALCRLETRTVQYALYVAGRIPVLVSYLTSYGEGDHSIRNVTASYYRVIGGCVVCSCTRREEYLDPWLFVRSSGVHCPDFTHVVMGWLSIVGCAISTAVRSKSRTLDVQRILEIEIVSFAMNSCSQ